MNPNGKSSNRLLLGAVMLCSFALIGHALQAQQFQPDTLLWRGLNIPGYTRNDTSLSDYFSTTERINYRKISNYASLTRQIPDYLTLGVSRQNLEFAELNLKPMAVDLGIYDSIGNIGAGLKVNEGGIDFFGNLHRFNGKGVVLPYHAPSYSLPTDSLEKGLMYFKPNSNTLMARHELGDYPAYWEWYNPANAATDTSFVYGYPDSWIERLNNSKPIPYIRFRHPLNVTGLGFATESEKKDFIIAPYEYGILMRYSGVFEADVSQFSIHVGTQSAPLDLEMNGRQGHGAVLWVGDDKDLGGLRATSRNKDSVFYSEISSEVFDGTSHGPLRFRIIDSTDRVEFVQGGRGYNRPFARLSNDSASSYLVAGENKTFSIGVDQYTTTINISPSGNTGFGATGGATSKVDIENGEGFNQLRLRKQFTPSGSSDSKGNQGDVAWDDNYIYLKTSTGWKRTKLESF